MERFDCSGLATTVVMTLKADDTKQAWPVDWTWFSWHKMNRAAGARVGEFLPYEQLIYWIKVLIWFSVFSLFIKPVLLVQ